MPIPRYYDEDKEVAYEIYWKCTKCGWTIGVNHYRIGKDSCILCDSPTKQVRIDYLHYSHDITKVLG